MAQAVEMAGSVPGSRFFEVTVKIDRCKDLIGVDKSSMMSSKKTSDPFVVVSCGSDDDFANDTAKVDQTEAVKGDLNPNFGGRMLGPYFVEQDAEGRFAPHKLQIEVYDEGDSPDVKNFLKTGFSKKKDHRLGFTEIDLGSWTQDHPQWQENTSTEMFPLTTDESLMKKKSAAEQQIFLELIFSERRTKPVEEEGDADSEEEEDGGDKRNAKLSPEAIQAANEAKKKEEEEKRALMKKMEEMEVVDGDYSLTVHIIEVRDLAPKAKFANADPVVEVHAFDQKATTVMKKDTLNAVFDETFQFNLKDVTRDDLEAGLIQLSVYDIDLIGRELIGSFATDFQGVYYEDDHEIYRRWVALINDQRGTGTQGFLQLSVSLIGPNDKMKYHDLAQEIEEEHKHGGFDVMNVMMPKIQQTLQFVTCKIYKAEGLPTMDFVGVSDEGLGTKNGIDAFVRFELGSEKVNSRPKKVSGKTDRHDVEWNRMLKIPVFVPLSIQSINISVWDEDASVTNLVSDQGTSTAGHQIVGSLPPLKTKTLLESGSLPPRWYNVYSGVLRTRFGNTDAINHKADEKDKMDKQAHKGSAWAGRVLLAFEMDKNDGIMKKQQKVYRKKNIKPAVLPPTVNYILRAKIFRGTQIPSFIDDKRVKVKIGFGPIALESTVQNNNNGCIDFENEDLQLEAQYPFPADLSQLPDLFIYIVKVGNVEPVCFRRLKVVREETNGNGPPELRLIGFDTSPSWVAMEREPFYTLFSKDTYPGSLLVQIGLGTAEQAAGIESKDPRKWSSAAVAEKARLTKQTLRVHVYQAREVSSADASGSSDPYIKVLFAGKEERTAKKEKTRNPSFFQTLEFSSQLPSDHALFPEVIVQTWDYDWGPDPDDYCGGVHIDTKAMLEEFAVEQKPRWYPLDTEGYVLVGAELVAEGAPLPDLHPSSRPYVLEITAVGLRGMQPLGMLLRKPFVEFQVGDSADKTVTQARSKPDAANPNFMETFTVTTNMPEDSLYSPYLNVTVRDRRLGGLSQPILGVGSILLSDRMPSASGEEESNHFRRVYCESPFVDPGAADVGTAGADTTAKFKAGPYCLFPMIELKKSNAATEGLEEKEEKAGEETRPNFEPLSANTDFLGYDKQFQRPTLDCEMENYYKSPFDTIPVFRGSSVATGLGAMLVGGKRQVGALKAIVRVFDARNYNGKSRESKQAEDVFNDPKPFLIRVYVLDTPGPLRAMDDNNKSDPYLVLKLGTTTIKDLENLKQADVQPQFYTCYELKSQLPGTSRLEISCYDRDNFSFDDLIGTTVVQLEDRWFSNGPPSESWQTYARVRANRFKVGDAVRIFEDGPLSNTAGKRFERAASKGTVVGANSDGSYRVEYVALGDDGLKVKQTKTVKTDLISPWSNSLPDYKRFEPIEVRRLWNPTSRTPQGSLRMFIEIVPQPLVRSFPAWDIAPPPDEEYEVRVIVYKVKDTPPGDYMSGLTDMYVKLHLGAEGNWQSSDTHLRASKGNGNFNWRYKFPITLPLKGEQLVSTYLTMQIWDMDMVYDDLLCEHQLNLSDFLTDAFKKQTSMQFKVWREQKTKAESGGKQGYDAIDMDDQTETYSCMDASQAAAEASALACAGQEDEEKEKEISLQAQNMNTENDYTEEDELLDEDTPLLGSGKKRKKANPPPPPKPMYAQMLNVVGMGPPPAEAEWIELLEKDATTGTEKPAGKILLSIEVLPKHEAENKAAGFGRSDPNQFPMLPQPAGRIDWTKMWNPLYALQACLGTGLLTEFACFLCCAIVIALAIFIGPTILDAWDIASDYGSTGLYVLLVLFLLVLCCLCYTGRKVYLCCGCGESAEPASSEEGDEGHIDIKSI